MESSVAGVGVFRSTCFAHREVAHGGHGTVVRDVLDDREAWSAVGAVDERVSTPAVGRIQELRFASATCGDVGRYQGHLTIGSLTLSDLESLESFRLHICCGDVSNEGHRWCFLAKSVHKSVYCSRFAFRVCEHALRGVEDPARDVSPSCECVDERTEPDSLDHAGDVCDDCTSHQVSDLLLFKPPLMTYSLLIITRSRYD